MIHYNLKSKKEKSFLVVEVKIQDGHIRSIQIQQVINLGLGQLQDQEAQDQYYQHAYQTFLENKKRISNK